MTTTTTIPEVVQPMPLLVGVDEVARALRICPQTVRRLAHDGKIPFTRLGDRLMRFCLADVLDALKGNAPATRRTRGATTHRPPTTRVMA